MEKSIRLIIFTLPREKKGKIITDSEGVKTTTDYLQGFQYKQEVLQFFPHAEGYVAVVDGKNFQYVYNYADHLGNVRLSYGADPANGQAVVLEESHYYPFGLKHKNYNAQQFEYAENENGVSVVLEEVLRKEYQYKYNGKEYQDELGLNLYDYGARNYDPAIGRWMNIDPLAEINSDWTPYRYGFNNPLTYTDPTGMLESTHTDEDGNVIAVYDDGDLGVYKHSNNADGGTPTKANIDKRHEKSTSAGGEKMGTTEFWNEFIIPGTNQAAGTILFGETSSWEPLIEKANNLANNQDLSVTMEQSKLNQRLDIKNNKNWAPESTGGSMTGRLLNGKYSTARSAGNYLAGMNGVTGTFQGMHISGETYMKIAGAYQVGQLSKANILRILTFGTSFGPAPYYGEEEYSGRRILQGITAGEKKLKN